MEPALISFINKLPPRHQSLPLKRSGRKVDNSIREIRHRLPDLAEEKVRALGIFMQHLSISKFTNDELLAVAKRRIDLIGATPNQQLDISIGIETGLYDTGSTHANKQLAKLGINQRDLNFMRARSSNSTSDIYKVLGL